MIRRRKRPPDPTPKELIGEAREKLDLAVHVLRSDEELSENLQNVEARVGALEYRVDVIFETYGGRR